MNQDLAGNLTALAGSCFGIAAYVVYLKTGGGLVHSSGSPLFMVLLAVGVSLCVIGLWGLWPVSRLPDME